MGTRVIGPTVLIGLTTLMLTGCGRQVAKMPQDDGDLLAAGPDQASLGVRLSNVLTAVEAAGGLPAWMQCRKVVSSGVVTIYAQDGSYYLTEHTFAVYPWSNAIRVSAREPRSTFVWETIRGQYRLLEGDPALDVSPLAGAYQDYIAAVLQIMTAPARLLDQSTQVTRQPIPVQIRGQQYDLINARFQAQQMAIGDKKEETVPDETYWTNGIYYQNRQTSRVEMIWLGNTAQQRFFVVRGYDYGPAAGSSILIPRKMEIFRSDAESRIGPRLVKVDLVM